MIHRITHLCANNSKKESAVNPAKVLQSTGADFHVNKQRCVQKSTNPSTPIKKPKYQNHRSKVDATLDEHKTQS